MLQYVLWAISFITLWLVIVWLNFLHSKKPVVRIKKPLITIAIPVFSRKGEKDPIKTLKSVFDSGYPAEKLDVVVVNDGSLDNTAQVLKDFQASHPEYPFRLVDKPNGGKASAVNAALELARGELFSVVDADSRIGKGSIEKLLPHFRNPKVGAVISRIKVDEPKNFWEKIQRFEYIMSTMVRKIMCNFGTLAMTPGVLSTYRTKLLREIGGFVRNRQNLTEDLEIALRLKWHGYKIHIAHDSETYTKVPDDLGSIWQQRTRWTRGYIYNHWNYRKMFFSKKYGLFGTFQLPINVLAVALLITNVMIIGIDCLRNLWDFAYRSLTIPHYFTNRLTDLPTLKEFILARNIHITLPIIIAFALSMYLMFFAHKYLKEKIVRNILPAASYILLVPYFTAANWLSSIAQEVFRTRRKW